MAVANRSANGLDMKFEVVVIPVSDVERAKKFYESLGFRLDADRIIDDESRLIQFTPPGSNCSIQFGSKLFGNTVTSAVPGSLQGLYLIVSDIEVAREKLVTRGIETSDIFHCPNRKGCRFPGNDGRVRGVHPSRASYSSFVSFCDPDGNGWLLQEVTTRLPGRVAGGIVFVSAGELAQSLRRAAAAHGQDEERKGINAVNWPDQYAEYLRREQSGEELPK